MNKQVAIIRTGTANLASVASAFDRLSISNRIVESPDQLQLQDSVVLPGVGAFAVGISTLTQNGWVNVLKKRFDQNLPTLAICLGLQLLAESSEEAPGQSGLGLLPAKVSRFSDDVTSPQLGWNRISGSGPLLKTGFAYFANSFCIKESVGLQTAGWNVATSSHGTEFVAAIQKGNWLACQFHPELSGQYGLSLLRNWFGKIDRPEFAATAGGAQC